MKALSERTNGALMLLAVVLVLGYLIARPHVGTVYVEEQSGSHIVSIFPDSHPHPWRPFHEFRSEALCEADASRNTEAESNLQMQMIRRYGEWGSEHVISFRCRAETRLLWGW